jgi:hypothetical protein
MLITEFYMPEIVGIEMKLRYCKIQSLQKYFSVEYIGKLGIIRFLVPVMIKQKTGDFP